jgi:5'-deoxynucleotidase
MAMAVYHEVSEVITGDLPSPIKHRDPDLRTAYGRIEAAARERLFSMLPEPLRDAYRPLLLGDDDDEVERLVKAADKLCAYLKCLEELAAGNAEFAEAKTTIEAEIEALEMPEVSYFMERFVPSFSLTLDELSR